MFLHPLHLQGTAGKSRWDTRHGVFTQNLTVLQIPHGDLGPTDIIHWHLLGWEDDILSPTDMVVERERAAKTPWSR